MHYVCTYTESQATSIHVPIPSILIYYPIFLWIITRHTYIQHTLYVGMYTYRNIYAQPVNILMCTKHQTLPLEQIIKIQKNTFSTCNTWFMFKELQGHKPWIILKLFSLLFRSKFPVKYHSPNIKIYTRSTEELQQYNSTSQHNNYVLQWWYEPWIYDMVEYGVREVTMMQTPYHICR